jgi:cold shock CspA family protein/ribosome-associated translation inhibitor RaiA
MPIPLQITFRGMATSPAVEAQIRDRVTKLERFAQHVLGCRLVVLAPHRHRRTGEIYVVRIDLRVPGHELVVNRDPEVTAQHSDVHVAVRDAFDVLRRKLEDSVRRRRGRVKTHEAPLWGRVSRVNPLDGFGFLEAADGLELYFHRNAIASGRFEDLHVGSEVRFSLSLGIEGPQASSVEAIGKHHVVQLRRTG